MTNDKLWEIWINEILYECFLCIGLNVCAWSLLTRNPTIVVWLTHPFRFRSILFLRSFVVHTAKPQSATLGCWFYSTKCIALSQELKFYVVIIWFPPLHDGSKLALLIYVTPTPIPSTVRHILINNCW